MTDLFLIKQVNRVCFLKLCWRGGGLHRSSNSDSHAANWATRNSSLYMNVGDHNVIFTHVSGFLSNTNCNPSPFLPFFFFSHIAVCKKPDHAWLCICRAYATWHNETGTSDVPSPHVGKSRNHISHELLVCTHEVFLFYLRVHRTPGASIPQSLKKSQTFHLMSPTVLKI